MCQFLFPTGAAGAKFHWPKIEEFAKVKGNSLRLFLPDPAVAAAGVVTERDVRRAGGRGGLSAVDAVR